MGQQMLPSSKGGWTYDVFLSLRREDTRYGSTGNLYHALHQRGINTFMDDEVIKRGEQISPTIFKAIDESRIAIVVFSKSYASSKWCLEEPVRILGCFKAKELVVYPVFYNVDPSEVRHQTVWLFQSQGTSGISSVLQRGSFKSATSQTASYGQQLVKHEEKMKDNKERVRNRRLALHEAANLAGWHFRDGTLKRNVLHVDDCAVGLQSRVSKIIYRLQMTDPTVIMVGICGAGGIGKTTLARAVYSSIGQEFEGLCFLGDVRGNSTKYGLAYLQEHEGIPILIRKLQNKRILLILDDVDKLDQLKNLAGACSWFGWGSRIIITTRYKDILAAHGVGNTYDVPGLNDYEALQLLSSNASKRPKPDTVWNRAIQYSHGLPLVLKVIGSDLLEKSTDECETALHRYGQVRNEEIQSILKVSYNSLNECEKRTSLDIACFFNGEPLPYVEEILSACGFYPKYGISKLVDRSLVSINGSRLMMHDHIIDMAVKVVQEESPMHPGKRSRLWLEGSCPSQFGKLVPQ